MRWNDGWTDMQSDQQTDSVKSLRSAQTHLGTVERHSSAQSLLLCHLMWGPPPEKDARGH